MSRFVAREITVFHSFRQLFGLLKGQTQPVARHCVDCPGRIPYQRDPPSRYRGKYSQRGSVTEFSGGRSCSPQSHGNGTEPRQRAPESQSGIARENDDANLFAREWGNEHLAALRPMDFDGI